MAQKKRSGSDTGFKDKDGKPILIHAHVADSSGTAYRINAYSQAVPVGDGVAVELDRLIKDGGVRVLSAQEVLQLQPSGQAAPEKKTGGRRKKSPEAPATDQAPAARGELENNLDRKSDKENAGDLSSDDIKAELNMLMGTIPSKMLAAELRRRGFVFSAVKPVIIEL